jgi:hypothetical protein
MADSNHFNPYKCNWANAIRPYMAAVRTNDIHHTLECAKNIRYNTWRRGLPRLYPNGREKTVFMKPACSWLCFAARQK